MDLSRASAAVGIDLANRYHSQIEELIDLGLLHQTGQNLRLTEPAYLIANQVFTRFID